jgi:hypothetical protein
MASNPTLSASCCHTNIKRMNNQELSASCHANIYTYRERTSGGPDYKRANNQKLSASYHANTNNMANLLSTTTPQRQARQRRNSIAGYNAKDILRQYNKILQESEDSARISRSKDDSSFWSLCCSLDARSTASFALSSPIVQQPTIAL